jgi:hypothetical protein
MAQDVSVLVNADDRARLAAIAGRGSRPHRHVVRARIILQSVERLPVQEVARRTGVSRPAVWRWQRYPESSIPPMSSNPKTRTCYKSAPSRQQPIKLKHFRHIATRYDRQAVHFLTALPLASAMIWMR